ncbi:MAG: DUF2817 domain-containing protein [Actinomycetota bacterium]
MTDRLAPDYAEARRRFLAAAGAAGAMITTHPHPEVAGPDGEELAVDVARLGRGDAPSVLIVVSGTHGVEGFAGSALQTQWLTRSAAELRPGLALVFVHALNPYGFAWVTRTNEDNVDLNRNFVDFAEPPANPGYDELAPMLVPERWDDRSRQTSTEALFAEAGHRGLEEMQRIISGGQYDHQVGVFYGGTGPVWSHRWLRANAPDLAGPARRVGVIDLHTGLGPWGHGELMVTPGSDDPITMRAKRWWGDVRSMVDGDSASAELTGDWLNVVEELWPSAEVTAVCLEYGTVDEVTVLQALRGEAWLFGERARLGHEPEAGGDGDAPGQAIRAEVRAAFADDDPAWLEALRPRFDDVMAAAIDQLAG